jgi:hypothetical protein
MIDLTMDTEAERTGQKLLELFPEFIHRRRTLKAEPLIMKSKRKELLLTASMRRPHFLRFGEYPPLGRC